MLIFTLFLYFDTGQLSVIERLFLAPTKHDDIAIERRDVSSVSQNLMDGPVQTYEWCSNGWQNFNAVSDLKRVIYNRLPESNCRQMDRHVHAARFSACRFPRLPRRNGFRRSPKR